MKVDTTQMTTIAKGEVNRLNVSIFLLRWYNIQANHNVKVKDAYRKSTATITNNAVISKRTEKLNTILKNIYLFQEKVGKGLQKNSNKTQGTIGKLIMKV